MDIKIIPKIALTGESTPVGVQIVSIAKIYIAGAFKFVGKMSAIDSLYPKRKKTSPAGCTQILTITIDSKALYQVD
ncbi:MAG: hypothetical protein DHS20C17_06200 [Cyclobacteriaceae bacterium]|nr:MAG: hypothetical protein DHS20C17_06200 [Cyclobacteriaceae bacterium]